jgi:prepilin-type N-terminal cleavage/methylation domain-containing protein
MNAPSSRAGFTLIEMLVSLMVFLLLAAAVFEIFDATLESASGLRDNQVASNRSEALGAWLKQSLQTLPAEGTLVSYHRDGRAFRVSGIIWGVGDNLQALDLQPQANGQYTLRLASFQPSGSSSPGNQGAVAGYSPALSAFQSEVFNDDSALAWRPLLHDLTLADWRFRVADITEWQDTSTGVRPVLVQLTFEMGGASSPIIDDFWIPPLQSPNGITAAPAPATSVTTNP